MDAGLRLGASVERDRDNRNQSLEHPTPRRHWWLFAIPYIWFIVAIPAVNQVGYVFGSIPFLLLWMVAGVIVSSGCVAAIYLADRRHGDLERV